MRTYKLFLPQHTASKHRVFAVAEDDFVEQVEAVATFPDPLSARCLADALNSVLDEAPNATTRLNRALLNAPQSLKAAVDQLVSRIAGDHSERSEFTALLRHTPLDGFMLFPVTGCPESGCDMCGEACQSGCRNCQHCTDIECEECWLGVPLTPRNAKLMHSVGEVLTDYLLEDIESGDSHPGRSDNISDLSLPRSAHGQNVEFYRRMTNAFDAMTDRLVNGEVPRPNSMAEEIALHFMIKDAERIYIDQPDLAEKFIEGLPESKYDYAWEDLSDDLFEDWDFHVYLSGSTIYPEGALDHWFEPFYVS